MIDTKMWPYLLTLRTCLKDLLVADGFEACLVAVTPGEDVDPSGVQNGRGLAWVRLASAFGSNSPPAKAVTISNCTTGLAARIEVGVLRCMPMPGRTQASLTQEQLEFAAEAQLGDMLLMQRALCCAERPFLLDNYTPLGPQGGVVGGAWSVLVGEGD